MKQRMTEAEIQHIVIQYVRTKYCAIATGTANGTANGKRPPVGILVGIPDVIVFEPRGDWHGLMIELKTEAGSASDIQEFVCGKMADRGYFVEVCYGVDAAIACIDEYFSNPRKKVPMSHFECRSKKQEATK